MMLSLILSILQANGCTDLHEIFSEGVEWPWHDPIKFLANSEKPRDATMHNTEGRGEWVSSFLTALQHNSNTGTGFVVLSHHSLFMKIFCLSVVGNDVLAYLLPF